MRSVSRVFLKIEKSTSASPGPLYKPRPTLPYVPGVGRTKALGLNHSVGLPMMTGPVKLVLKLGRSGLRVSPSPERFEPTCGVNGNPLSSVVIRLTCQPLMKRLVLFDHGRS